MQDFDWIVSGMNHLGTVDTLLGEAARDIGVPKDEEARALQTALYALRDQARQLRLQAHAVGARMAKSARW